MNLTYQYLRCFSFNNWNFRFNHIHTSSLTNILYLFLFYHITNTKFTVKSQAPKYRSCNKEKKKEDPSTKRPFVSRGCWPQWEIQFNFFKSSFFIFSEKCHCSQPFQSVHSIRKQRRLKLFAWYITARKCL